jgi:hypothetical protein
MSNITLMILFILTILVVLALYRQAKEEESFLMIKLVGFTSTRSDEREKIPICWWFCRLNYKDFCRLF